MKKMFVIIVLFAGLQNNFFAQGYGSTTSACTTDALQNLANCLRSHGITYSMASHNGTYYIQAEGNPPPGQVQSCIAHYNSDSGSCPDAPIVVQQVSIISASRYK